MRKLLNILSIVAIVSPSFLVAQTFQTGTNLTIPDAGAEVCSGISVTGVGAIDGTYGLESVSFKINHTWDSDLDIFLQAPDGTRVELSTDNGGSGSNYGSGTTNNATPWTTVIMTAGTNITAGTAPFTATTYVPEGDLGDVNNGQNANGTWSLCVTDDAGGDTGFINAWSLTFSASPAPPPGPAPTGSTCATATVIGSLPYTNTGLNTSGFGDDYSSLDACGSSYMNGDDYVFSYTPAANECIDLTLSNTGTWVGAFILDGCPDAAGTTCVASNTNSSGNPAITGTNLTGGTTYYFVVSTYPSPQSTAFDISVSICSGGGGGPTGSTCATADVITSLPYVSTGMTTSGFGDDYSSLDACGSSYMNGDDYVFSYTPAANECIDLTLSNTGTWVGAFILDGCPDAAGTTCVASNTNSSGNPAITGTNLTGGTTYYFVVSTYPSPQSTAFDISVSICSGGGGGPTGSTCATADVITSLPYVSTGMTTNGFGDDYSSLDACGSSYMNGDDYVFSYTPAANECIDLTLSNTGTWVGAFILDGCPDAAGTTCVASNTNSSGNPAVTGTNLTGGTTYYFVVSTYPSPQFTAFDIDVRACPPPPVNDDPCSATSLTVGATCTMASYTTSGATSSSGVPAPGCANYTGSDVWFTAIVPASGQMAIDSDVGVITDAGMAVYTGTCGSLALLECDDNDSPNGLMSYIEVCSLPAGTQIWIRFWEYGGDNNGSFDICAYDIGGGACPVDQVIASIPFTQTGLTTAGAGDDFSSADACGSSYMNGDDYTFEYTATGAEELTITLSNTGTWVGVFVTDACPNSCSASCIDPSSGGCTGTTTNTSSTGNPSGTWSLPGAGTYYITVSTSPAPQTTAFDIDIQSTSGGGAIPGQDCSIPIPVCNSTISVGNPGYAGTGNICDFDGTNNCTGGEKNSVWYQIDIATAGTVNFTIMPNDGTNTSCGFETDYDFIMWRTVAGNGTDPVADCSDLTGTGSSAIVACNFDPDGVTGVAAGGNAPAPIDFCFDFAFEPTVNVNAGDQYFLVIQNFSGSTQGFTLDLTSSGAGVVNYSSPSTIYWTGGASTAWNNSVNWGSCTTPACSVSGVVTTASTTQPVVTGTKDVNDLTINPGATLTIDPGATLNICGDFINNGTLVADPTSNIRFVGSGTQNVTGNFTGTNAMGNVVVAKASGSVVLNSAVEMEGNFFTNTATSIWNNNGQDMTLAGNFSLNNPTTFIGSDTTSTLTFDGTALQQFTPSGTLTVNNFTMNNTGAGMNMNSTLILGTSGTLTLTDGVMITGANRVEVTNTASSPVATTTGNVGSYVEGNLRRYISSTGSFDLPVGHATQGYQRANLTFTAATLINYFDVRFDPYAPNPGALGAAECGTTYDLNALDNGFWTITADANIGTGTYNTTLYNTNYTNAGAATAWTVMRSNGTWGLVNGDCVASGPAVVVRDNMSGFSLFGVAQATTPLPIELVRFTGENIGEMNRLNWVTATEINNDYFTVEKSRDGIEFYDLGEVEGAGNSAETRHYSFDDLHPDFGINYYRLKQTDFDGQYSRSDVVAIENSKAAEINVIPNPATNTISFTTDLSKYREATVRLYGIIGNLLLEKKLNPGNANDPIDIADLPAGHYSVIIDTDSMRSVIKLIKE